MEHFGGKVAIVTGGASGIGRSICTYLGRHGAQVIVEVFWLLHRAVPGFHVAMWTMVIKRMRAQA